MLRNLIKTKTIKQTAIVLPATVVNGVLGMLFFLSLARLLNPSDLGAFSVSVTIMALIASIANASTDTGVIRFVGANIKQDKQRALRFMKLALEVKVITFLFILVFGWLVMPFVASSILQKPELVMYLRLSLIGVGSAVLISFASASLQALQKFSSWGAVNISANLLRLVVLLLLGAAALANTDNVLLIYIAAPMLGFFLSLVLLPNFFVVAGETRQFKDFFQFNKWVTLFVIIAAISSRLDTLIAARYLNLSQVGIYSVAVSLAAVGVQIVSSIATVVAPKLASFENNQKAIVYLKKLQLLVCILAVVMLIGGGILGWVLIPSLYGQVFRASVLPFVILLLAQAVFLIAVPVHTAVIYYFSYPKLFVIINMVNLIFVLLAGVVVIPWAGVVGAASIVLLGNLISFLWPLVWVINKFKK